MMQVKPHLFLKRLVIKTHSGETAYDEFFHTGVNVIRGRNSSGKSTIANFIFYALGGDFSNWTTAALRCKEVYAELNVSDAILTVKRVIGESGAQPMSIFWGPFTESNRLGANWQIFPYRQTENKISFSKVLFGALSFPEVRTDNDSTITMHQILRLLYIDQDTSTQSLFRSEKFDPPLTRQTIAEVLLGIYDDTLYRNRIELRNSQKKLDITKSQYEGIIRIYGKTGGETSVEKIKQEIDSTNLDIRNIDESLLKLRENSRINITKKTVLLSESLQDSLMANKNKVRQIKDKVSQLELDIFDSKQFIDTLSKRVNELDNSLLTRKVLGELPLTHCPQCLNPLETHISDEHCSLCKQPIGEEAERTQAKRLKQEMELQIRESQSIMSDKNKDLIAYQVSLPIYIEKARSLQKALNSSIQESQSTRDERIDSLLVAKGSADKKLEYLLEQMKAVETLETLRNDIIVLEKNISNLKDEITLKERNQYRNQQLAISTIKKFTIELLRKDLPLQGEFKTGNIVEVDFTRDTYSLDGGNNFSASSKTYFKNSILYAIFFSSLELSFFRYPRFILCDNMEDKGMEKERTQNFQNQVVKISQRIEEPHQIIFTTSMVSDELNNNTFCVGQFYDEDHKTLNI